MSLPGQLGGSATREEKVYADGRRADINHTPLGDPEYFIELKCQSLVQDGDNFDLFANRIVDDMVKCDRTLTDRAAGYEDMPAVAIGIGVDEGGVKRAMDIFSEPTFQYRDKTYWTQAPNNGPMVFLIFRNPNVGYGLLEGISA